MKILFLGDIYLDNSFDKDNKFILEGIKDNIDQADFVIANLEAPITSSNDKTEKVGPLLKMANLPDELVNEVDAFSLANNHMMDFKSEGLSDTIKYLKAKNINYFGAGESIDAAYRGLTFEKGGQKVTLIGMAENEFSLTFGSAPGVAPVDPVYSLAYLTDIIKKNDNVVLFIHGGNEFSSLPSPKYRKLCQMYIDIGVKAVISTHTHTIGPIEEYKSAPIIYSLGNCLFNSQKPPEGWNIGMAVELEFNKSKVNYNKTFFEQNSDKGGVRALKSQSLHKVENDFKKLCSIIVNADSYHEAWERFVSERGEEYLFRVSSPVFFRGAYRICKALGINRLLCRGLSGKLKQNYISCESHREVVLESLSRLS